MWETFWPDVLVAFIGACFTVAIAFGTYIARKHYNEKQALRGLISDLHHRRALAVIHPQIIQHAEKNKDFERASLSVIDIRDHIRRTRDQVRPGSLSEDSLSRMIRSCNVYLEKSELTPKFYAYLLMDLKSDLHEGVLAITKHVRLAAYEPGAGAFVDGSFS